MNNLYYIKFKDKLLMLCFAERLEFKIQFKYEIIIQEINQYK